LIRSHQPLNAGGDQLVAAGFLFLYGISKTEMENEKPSKSKRNREKIGCKLKNRRFWS